MNASNKKKNDQLGMSHGTAVNRLRKNIMFALILRCGLNTCHQCGEKINTPAELSVEHKTPWLDSDDPKGLFFDLNNIAFSHLRCNCAAARKPEYPLVHGVKGWRRGCRCRVCLDAKNEEKKRYRARKK
jgi:hypothetical protein